MSRAVVALCHWQDFNYGREPGDEIFRQRDEPPTACRASLGDKLITVWLPQGAVIRCRVPRFQRDGYDPMRDYFGHVYGSHERMTRTRIRITLTALPNLGE